MVKINFYANILGQGINSILGLLFTPLYIKYLGVESFGVIGIFAIIQSAMMLFDFGLIPALGREVSRFVGGQKSLESFINLLRSVEIIIFIISFLLCLFIFIFAEKLAIQWLNEKSISNDIVINSFYFIGVITVIKFIENIYKSVLIGLQKQIILNILLVLTAFFKALGSVFVLEFIAPDLNMFFVWQLFSSIFSLALFYFYTYFQIPKLKFKGKFDLNEVRIIGSFGIGILVINFLAFFLTQVDKILLSSLLSLNDYGYYTIVSIVSGVLFTLVNPITTALYPKFCELISKNNTIDLIHKFHKGSQLVTVLVGSIAIFIFIFSKEILLIWLNDKELSSKISLYLSILILGNFFNCLNWIPYQLQLAYGSTKIGIRSNLVGLILIVPALFYFVPIYGILGASIVWVLLNMGYLTISLHFMFKKFLINEKFKWYFFDTFLPLILTMIFIYFYHIMFNNLEYSFFNQLIFLSLGFLLTFFINLLFASKIRTEVFLIVNKMFFSWRIGS